MLHENLVYFSCKKTVRFDNEVQQAVCILCGSETSYNLPPMNGSKESSTISCKTKVVVSCMLSSCSANVSQKWCILYYGRKDSILQFSPLQCITFLMNVMRKSRLMVFNAKSQSPIMNVAHRVMHSQGCASASCKWLRVVCPLV